MLRGDVPTRTVGRSRAVAVLGVAVLACIGAAYEMGRWRTPRPSIEDGVAGPDRTEILPEQDGPLSERERRGKDLYEKGASLSGQPVTAVLGDSGTEVPVAVLRCVNCHGRDGRGISEGGISPPNITWQELTKPYGATTANGRRRPAYTPALLKRTLSLGRDSADQPLGPSMPRYRLGLQDADDLIAYLMRLGHAPSPGLSPTAVRLACILPTGGESGAPGRAVFAALRAFVDQVNADGGVYGRRLDIRFITPDGSPDALLVQLRRLVESGDVFALVGSDASNAEREVADLAREAAMPVIGCLAPFRSEAPPPNRYVFYVDGGVVVETMVLLDDALRDRPAGFPADVAILAGPAEPLRAIARAVERRVRDSGGSVPALERTAPDPRAVAEGLRRDGVRTLLILDSPAGSSTWLRIADGAGWSPRVLLAGSLATPAVFEFPERTLRNLRLAFGPTLAVGGQAGLVAYRRLAAKARLPSDHLPEQLESLASAALLVEGLKRSGRDVSRESLVDQLERVTDFPTDFSPPLTFNPRRRVGARGAFIVRPRPAGESRGFERLTGWVEPKD